MLCLSEQVTMLSIHRATRKGSDVANEARDAYIPPTKNHVKGKNTKRNKEIFSLATISRLGSSFSIRIMATPLVKEGKTDRVQRSRREMSEKGKEALSAEKFTQAPVCIHVV